MNKEKKDQKKKRLEEKRDYVISKKRDFREIIEYLVDSYYLNCNEELNKNNILKELNISEGMLIDNFFKYLRNNNYIKLIYYIVKILMYSSLFG